METRTTRPTILCPACGRELHHLRRPQCLWCGASLSLEQYETVAAPPLRVMGLPPSLPMVAGPTPGPVGWGIFSRCARPLSPWEKSLRLAFGIVGGSVGLVKLAVTGVAAWHLHQMMQTLPPHP